MILSHILSPRPHTYRTLRNSRRFFYVWEILVDFLKKSTPGGGREQHARKASTARQEAAESSTPGGGRRKRKQHASRQRRPETARPEAATENGTPGGGQYGTPGGGHRKRHARRRPRHTLAFIPQLGPLLCGARVVPREFFFADHSSGGFV